MKVLTQPAKKSRRKKEELFAIMPASPEFDDIYFVGIANACEAIGAIARRVDLEEIFSWKEIYEQIRKADFVVADLSGHDLRVL